MNDAQKPFGTKRIIRLFESKNKASALEKFNEGIADGRIDFSQDYDGLDISINDSCRERTF